MGTFLDNGIIVTPHNDKKEAVSIMGQGGNAMVIPTINNAWTGKANPWISQTNPNNVNHVKAHDWSADGEGDMYLSVLIRVTTKKEGTQVYPYRNYGKMNVVYLTKNVANNIITGRVDKNAAVAADQEVMEFGWAAVPVSVKWERGKHYVYVLDFTNGVGIQDPEDENPGNPILGSGISFTVDVSDWTEGFKEESDGDVKYPAQ